MKILSDLNQLYLSKVFFNQQSIYFLPLKDIPRFEQNCKHCGQEIVLVDIPGYTSIRVDLILIYKT